jgi:uncharacterized protein YjbI with pentapeptide repeats
MPRRKNPSTGMTTALALGGLGLAGLAAYFYTRAAEPAAKKSSSKKPSGTSSTEQPLPTATEDCVYPVMVDGKLRYPTGAKDASGQCIFEEPEGEGGLDAPKPPKASMSVEDAIAQVIATYDDKALAEDQNAFIDLVFLTLYPSAPEVINASAAHAPWRAAWLSLVNPVALAQDRLKGLPEPVLPVDAAIAKEVEAVQQSGDSPTLTELAEGVFGRMYPDATSTTSPVWREVFEYVTSIVEYATNWLFGWLGGQERIDSDSLGRILDDHAKFGRSGGTEGKLADLSNVNLRGVDLTKVYLEGANLEGANLTATILTDADLRGANLTGATLDSAVLYRTDLGEANLTKTSARKSDFRDANLSSAKLEEAQLDGSKFTGADMRSVYADGAKLDGASLEGATLDGANFTNASLVGANLVNAKRAGGQAVSGVNFSGANLASADLRFAKLRAANFRKAILTDALLEMADLTDAGLTNMAAKGVDLTDANLTGAFLWDSDLEDALLFGANFTNADLKGAGFVDARVDQRTFDAMANSRY